MTPSRRRSRWRGGGSCGPPKRGRTPAGSRPPWPPAPRVPPRLGRVHGLPPRPAVSVAGEAVTRGEVDHHPQGDEGLAALAAALLDVASDLVVAALVGVLALQASEDLHGGVALLGR